MSSRPLALLLALFALACIPRAEERRGLPYAVDQAGRVGDIYHLPTGLRLTLTQAADLLAGARLVCIGETHDNIHAHEVELAVLRELERRFPGKVALGMEMFREPQQKALDQWSRGELSELEFLKASQWFHGWGSDFGYYRAILELARDRHLDILALNPPEELQRAVAKHGLEHLSPQDRGRLPDIGPVDPYQREALQAIFGGHHHGGDSFEDFLRVQLLWEETMAQRVVEYLQSPRGQGKILVTLTGSFHVEYGFGLPKKVLRRLALPYAVVLPKEIEIPPEKQADLMDVQLTPPPLLPAELLFLVRYEDLEGQRAQLGVAVGGERGRVLVESLGPSSAAAQAGIAAGDQLLSIGGEPVQEPLDVVLLVSQHKPKERVAVTFRRGAAERTVEVELGAAARPAPRAKPQ